MPGNVKPELLLATCCLGTKGFSNMAGLGQAIPQRSRCSVGMSAAILPVNDFSARHLTIRHWEEGEANNSLQPGEDRLATQLLTEPSRDLNLDPTRRVRGIPFARADGRLIELWPGQTRMSGWINAGNREVWLS